MIKKSIRSHQLEAMRAVNRELVALYWEIGKAIQRKQEQLGWGKAVVETLAKDLQAEFPGGTGSLRVTYGPCVTYMGPI